ncbi:hypothetical protein Tco_1551454, partial [Tanacetum coccineum]
INSHCDQQPAQNLNPISKSQPVRSQLQLADDDGIDDLPIAEIYSGMGNIGYVTEGKLTFYKNKFSPQWRFLVHTILHCLSTKDPFISRRKSLGRNCLTKPKSILKELDLDADDKTFIKVVFDEDSTDEAPILWSALAGWEVISTPLGEINALYRSDQSTKYFTTLGEILYMMDRQDLLKLYGMVVTYYENHPIAGAGAGLMLWGNLQVLMDS